MRDEASPQSAREQYLVAFYSTTHTMETYADAKTRFAVSVMPVPRQISKSCGLALEYRGGDPSAFRAYFETLKVPARLFLMETPGPGKRRAVLVAEHTLNAG